MTEAISFSEFCHRMFRIDSNAVFCDSANNAGPKQQWAQGQYKKYLKWVIMDPEKRDKFFVVDRYVPPVKKKCETFKTFCRRLERRFG